METNTLKPKIKLIISIPLWIATIISLSILIITLSLERHPLSAIFGVLSVVFLILTITFAKDCLFSGQGRKRILKIGGTILLSYALILVISNGSMHYIQKHSPKPTNNSSPSYSNSSTGHSSNYNTSYDCYVCGKTASTTYGSLHYCSRCYAMVKTVVEAD